MQITVPLLKFNTPFILGNWSPPPRTLREVCQPHWVVEIDQSSYPQLLNSLRKGEGGSWEWFSLAYEAQTWLAGLGGQSMRALEFLAGRWEEMGIVPYPHQIETARRVVEDLGGRVLLADEVGLGKTIEAGLILKEYQLRGWCKKALILTPAGICRQWQQELSQKFGVFAHIQRREWDWDACDCLIASIDTAKREPHRSKILDIPYDLVIIDESHKLKNPRTQNFKLVAEMQKKYFLLLTATPVQNDLKELYNLITLLRPGQLGTYKQFQKDFVVEKRKPKNLDGLRGLLSEVMIRNRRSEVQIDLPPRSVHKVPVQMLPEEEAFYTALRQVVQELAGRKTAGILPLITLEREACSSVFAAAYTLEKMVASSRDPQTSQAFLHLLQLACSVRETAKAQILEDLVQKTEEQILVFTEYRATQQYLINRLKRAGYSVLGFDGSMGKGKKDWHRYLFRQGIRVLVSTEAGGEGLNFQFCNTLVNYDLPWNPMRLEQRIGRVHRLGQTRDVQVFNFATQGTIEDSILHLLQEKIEMFHQVIGNAELILAQLEAEGSIEEQITQVILGAADRQALEEGFERLGSRLAQVREKALEERPLWADL